MKKQSPRRRPRIINKPVRCFGLDAPGPKNSSPVTRRRRNALTGLTRFGLRSDGPPAYDHRLAVQIGHRQRRQRRWPRGRTGPVGGAAANRRSDRGETLIDVDDTLAERRLHCRTPAARHETFSFSMTTSWRPRMPLQSGPRAEPEKTGARLHNENGAPGYEPPVFRRGPTGVMFRPCGVEKLKSRAGSTGGANRAGPGAGSVFGRDGGQLEDLRSDRGSAAAALAQPRVHIDGGAVGTPAVVEFPLTGASGRASFDHFGVTSIAAVRGRRSRRPRNASAGCRARPRPAAHAGRRIRAARRDERLLLWERPRASRSVLTGFHRGRADDARRPSRRRGTRRLRRSHC